MRKFLDPPLLGTITFTLWQVEVYTFSSEAWRSIITSNRPRNAVKLTWNQVVVDGFIYWLDIDVISAEKRVYGVWMMEHGVPNSCTKLFTIRSPDASIRSVLGFRKNNEPIFAMRLQGT
ncbi:hypothetical protein Hanom_Chr13g01243361 [Helianthus anomalus]